MTSNHAPISSCMVVLDHSQYMLNEDFEPTRFEFQQQAASYIVDCILEEALTMKSNGNTSVSIPKIGVMAGTDVLIGPQEDTAIVYEALADNLALATPDLTTSLRVASLALRKFEKEYAGEAHDEKQENFINRKVIIAFVGSPLNDDDDNLDHVGRILKRNATEIIIVAVGDDSDCKSLRDLVSIADGKVVKINREGGARDALDGLFASTTTRALETSDKAGVLLPATKSENDHDASHRIGALLNRSRVERGKIELMLKTSFSSEVIPSPPAMKLKDSTTFLAHGRVDSKIDDEKQEDPNDDEHLPSPASSEIQWVEDKPFDERGSPLLKALECGPEIVPQLKPTTKKKPQLTIQVNNNNFSDRGEFGGTMNEEEVELERHMSMSPTSGGTDLRQEQENIARFANLRQTHISVAEYERVKTELRAAKRYIRVLQRLVHEKDEMITALHDMIGCLRSQINGFGTEKSEVTSLTLDGDSESNDDVGIFKLKNLEEGEDNILKPSLSSDSHISLHEIRKRTRELEALHAALTKKSRALEKTSLSLKSKSSQTLTMTEKRNKKRELEALRASITAS